jgi:hypothetical protein
MIFSKLEVLKEGCILHCKENKLWCSYMLNYDYIVLIFSELDEFYQVTIHFNQLIKRPLYDILLHVLLSVNNHFEIE